MNKTLEEKIKRNGVKIKKVEMAEIVMVEKGLREHISNNNCIFAYSLLLRELVESNRHKGFASRISKNAFCKDIICVDYNFGLQSYTSELDRLNKDYKYKIEHIEFEEGTNEYEEELKVINKWYKDKKDIIDKFYKEECIEDYSRENLRINSYVNGFDLDGIHYVMWFRTPAKARVGQIYFINSLYKDKIYAWQTMGIKLPKEEAKIGEMGAYMSLTASHIENVIKINPKNILVLKDWDSISSRNCAIVKTDEDGKCIVEYKESEVKNTLWDGMAIIEDSKCPSFINGGALLRQHMFKAFASRGYIQKFFIDYCNENELDYNSFEVVDMWGNKHKAKDIEMITTENAVKWTKFNFTYEEWCKKVKEDNNIFGVCKTDYKSKICYGELQQASYQMVNSLINLDEEQVKELCGTSLDYLNSLKDVDNLVRHLEERANFSNCYEMIAKLIKLNRDLADTEIIRTYVSDNVIQDCKAKFKGSKLLFNADNLVLVGNPYGLLLHSVGAFTGGDKTLEVSGEYISCYTTRFRDGEMLAGFRSPHNSPNNIMYCKNSYSKEMTKYFNLSDNILVVNGIGNDIQNRGNGLDFDSDMVFLTNNNIIVESAKECYKEYPTIVNAIAENKKTYNNTLYDYAIVDHNLAKAKRGIGEFSNIAQIALSRYYINRDNSKYKECFEISSVLAQVAIDNAKREYEVDLLQELGNMRKISGGKFPSFFRMVNKKIDKNERENRGKQINYNIKCVSNIVIDIIDNGYVPNPRRDKYKEVTINMKSGKANNRQVARMKTIAESIDDNYVKLISDESNQEEGMALLLFENSELMEEVKNIKINNTTYSSLLSKCFNKEVDNRMYILNCLYNADKERFLSFFTSDKEED